MNIFFKQFSVDILQTFCGQIGFVLKFVIILGTKVGVRNEFKFNSKRKTCTMMVKMYFAL